MKSTLLNCIFSVLPSGGSYDLKNPTTRLFKQPHSPEGRTLNLWSRHWWLAGFILPLLAISTLAQSLDLEGRAVNPLESPSQQTVVLIFVRTDCPISNRYAPELQRLQRQFKNIRFWLVYPNDEAAAIEQHLVAFGFTRTRVLRDPQQTLVKLARAQVTPEAAVFVSGELIYRGRIDDRVIAFGKQRAQPKQRDLQTVLNALRSGAKFLFKEQPAVGCYIVKSDER